MLERSTVVDIMLFHAINQWFSILRAPQTTQGVEITSYCDCYYCILVIIPIII